MLNSSLVFCPKNSSHHSLLGSQKNLRESMRLGVCVLSNCHTAWEETPAANWESWMACPDHFSFSGFLNSWVLLHSVSILSIQGNQPKKKRRLLTKGFNWWTLGFSVSVSVSVVRQDLMVEHGRPL